ncbi:DUF1611 domain-containing protein [Blastopirellula retiformator]|uniref:DUF1611 domain-containing protein n=1 Tax=Blastopirellula retiformator TaxID=2527970 RepID=A0A5C5V996_9BACT|nr:DUF1611 domain-containing protein [Blastopirellula retiformator]TWT34437.1 hypothetical protein Enr8_18450 [Blastopirellula retiformator]
MTIKSLSLKRKKTAPHGLSEPTDLSAYRRIVVLTEGHTNPQKAKTAIGLLRFRGGDVVALLDSQTTHQSAAVALAHDVDVPIVTSLADVSQPDALFVGISPAGGRLPPAMQGAIYQAAQQGLDVVSGLHDFLVDDPALVDIASRTGARLIDVRRNGFRETAKHASFREGCLRVLTVGHDCSVGKMFAALEVERELLRRGADAKFLATGQTGIMIAGNGVPIDCVVSDFINGAVENWTLANQQHDYLLIEGQGSVTHPAYSAVTVGLLHGCAPDGLIFCYEAGRTTTKGLDHVPLKPLTDLRNLYEALAQARNECEVIGVAINGRRLGPDEAAQEQQRVSAELGLPACDVYRDGPGVLANAVVALREQVVD